MRWPWSARRSEALLVAGVLSFVSLPLSGGTPRGGEVDPSFDPGRILGPVYALAHTPWDGQVLVAGSSGIMRLGDPHPLATVTGGSGRVRSVTLQYSDHKILIGGAFTGVNGVPRSCVARLNADGSLDTTFGNANVGDDQPEVRSVVLQSDGKVLIAGTFTSVQGESRNRIARLNADGSLDTSFLNGMSGADGEIDSVALEDGVLFGPGRILIGGFFTKFNGEAHHGIARLLPDGNLDTSVGDVSGIYGVRSVEIAPYGNWLIGGIFTSVNEGGWNRVAVFGVTASQFRDPDNDVDFVRSWGFGNGGVLFGGAFSTVNGVSHNRIAALNPDGSLDATFQNGMTGANHEVRCVAGVGNGDILIGGDFDLVNGESAFRIASLHGDGSTAPYVPCAPSWIGSSSLALQPDGRVLVGGANACSFSDPIRRMNADGSLDTGFLTWVNGGVVQSIAVQADGKILIGGYFARVNDVPQHSLARLEADGSLDTSFPDPQISNGFNDAWVYSMALQPDGKVVIGGGFSSPKPNVARLNGDGTLDTSFHPAGSWGNLPVYSLALQPDGKVVVGGAFNQANQVARHRIARLNANGTLDTTFQSGMAGANAAVHAVAVQPDGKVVIGGEFTTVNGVSRNGIARLYADGSLDTSFLDGVVGVSGAVHSVALRPDGKILIGGDFSGVNGASRTRIARLHADGSLDRSFQEEMSGAMAGTASVAVNGIALEPDGRVWIVGDFSHVNGISRYHIARLYADAPSGSDPDADGISSDNCPLDFNPSQSDIDQDGEGDACDLDDGSIWEWRDDRGSISWQREHGSDSWNVYVGDLGLLQATGVYTQDPGSNPLASRHCGETYPRVDDPAIPVAGSASFSLVTGVTNGVEGSLGSSSRGARPNANPCP